MKDAACTRSTYFDLSKSTNPDFDLRATADSTPAGARLTVMLGAGQPVLYTALWYVKNYAAHVRIHFTGRAEDVNRWAHAYDKAI
ncbi:hypothetical protein USB125703_02060 [Pseudoclavibacter triregionum]|nr:hypothetical protein USB125703_02060 [Pseudoclavibacter triregionum]